MTKVINYKGNEYGAPDWARFIATDEDGGIYAFDIRPELGEDVRCGWIWGVWGRQGRCVQIGQGGTECKNSLVELEDEQL